MNAAIALIAATAIGFAPSAVQASSPIEATLEKARTAFHGRWHGSIAEAAKAAAQIDRPLLVLATQGHPLRLTSPRARELRARAEELSWINLESAAFVLLGADLGNDPTRTPSETAWLRGSGVAAGREGLYFLAPSGRLLGSVTLDRLDQLPSVAEQARAKYGEFTLDERKGSVAALASAPSLPDNGLELIIASTRLSGSGAPTDANAWQRDFLWISAERWKTLAMPRGTVGDEKHLGDDFLARLAQTAFIDTFAADPQPWPPSAAVRGDIVCKVIEVRGDQIRVTVDGRVEVDAAQGKAATTVTGTYVYNDTRATIDWMSLVAETTLPGGERIGYLITVPASRSAISIRPTFLMTYIPELQARGIR
ncbi:MAG: hypothetical protein ACK4XJ_09115 [Fimbriimonadaceae bacterium]